MIPAIGPLRVTSAQAIHHGVSIPSLRGGEFPARSALVSITAAASNNRVVRGLGESQIQGSITGDSTQRSLAFLERALHRLEKRTISLDSPEHALSSIREVISDIRQSALPTEAAETAFESPTARAPHTPEFAGTLFGLESALLDLVSQAMDITQADLLAEGSRLQSTAPVIFPLLRPTSLKFATTIRGQIVEADALSDAGGVWLDGGRRFDKKRDLFRWIKKLVSPLEDEQASRTVYLFRPLTRRHDSRMSSIAEQLGERFENSRCHVVLIREISQSATDLYDMEHVSPHFAVGFRPSSTGGPLATVDLAQQLDNNTNVQAFLIANPSTGKIALDTLIATAHAIPAVRGIAIPGGHSGEELLSPLEEDFWKKLLADSTTKVTTSGNTFLHTEQEQPNYYEEEKYLAPVGPVGSKARLLQKAALLSGFDTMQYAKSSFAVTDQANTTVLFHGSATPINTAAAKAICNHKETTRLILQKNGVPTPTGRTFKHGDHDTARQYAAQLGYPVVVKPAMGTMGIGVKAGIQNENELNLAFAHLTSSKLADQGFIVEKHLFGEEYRILVIGGKVIAAVRREPASVVGDGLHSVVELIVRKNHFRGTNPQLASSPIAYTNDSVHMLDEQGLSLTSVPALNQLVKLSSSSNISLGGDSRQLVEDLHPTIKAASIKAVESVPGLNYCGVDFLLEDPTLPLDQQSAGICELNAQAATGTAEYPLFGTRQPVPQTTIDTTVDMFDLQVTAPSDLEKMAVKLKIKGRVTNVGYRKWFARWAREFDVVGTISNTNSRTVEVTMMGNSMAIAALSAAAIRGPRKAKPTSVSTQHIPAISDDEFVILS